MGILKVECEVGSVSDGLHTFDELYEHRHWLMLALMKANVAMAWMSLRHADGTSLPGWFLVGVTFPHGEITYHLPIRLYAAAKTVGAAEVDRAPAWDGHTSQDVITRLKTYVWEETSATPGDHEISRESGGAQG